MRKVFLLCILLLAAGGLFAQIDSTIDFNVGRSFKRLNRPFLEFSTEQGGASRQWSSLQLYNFFFGDFIDDSGKQALADRASSGLNLSYMQNWDIQLCYEGHQKTRLMPFPKQSMYLFNRSYTVLNMSGDLTNLFLYGNKSSRGRPQDLSDFSYQSWFYSGIGHQYTFLIDTIPLSVGIGLVALHTNDYHQTGQASLTTASDGSELSFVGNYQFGQSGATSTYGISGWGFALNLETAEVYDKHDLKLGIRDLGLVNMPDWLDIQRDSSFTFSGLNAGNLFSLEQETFSQLLDSLGDGLVGGNRPGKWSLLPFHLYLDYAYHYSKRQYAYASINYRYLPEYLPRFALGYGYEWDELSLRGGLAYGGFNNLAMDLGFRWELNSAWHLRGGLTNFFGIGLPTWSGGSMAQLAVRYIF